MERWEPLSHRPNPQPSRNRLMNGPHHFEGKALKLLKTTTMKMG